MTFFSRWLEDQGRIATLDELHPLALREWLAQPEERQEPVTVKTRYRGRFSFCGRLVDEQELAQNSMRTDTVSCR